jgi:hypothetical protein
VSGLGNGRLQSFLASQNVVGRIVKVMLHRFLIFPKAVDILLANFRLTTGCGHTISDLRSAGRGTELPFEPCNSLPESRPWSFVSRSIFFKSDSSLELTLATYEAGLANCWLLNASVKIFHCC